MIDKFLFYSGLNFYVEMKKKGILFTDFSKLQQTTKSSRQ